MRKPLRSMTSLPQAGQWVFRCRRRGRCRRRRTAGPPRGRSCGRAAGRRPGSAALLQLVGRVEAGDMPGDLGAELVGDEAGHVAQFRVAVVAPGDHQGGHLEPDAEAPIVAQAVEHPLQGGAGDLPVEFLGEALEVDVGRIEVGGDGRQGLGGGVAVADEDVLEPGRLGQHGRVVGVFEVDGRLGVGVGDAAATGGQGPADDLGGARSAPGFPGGCGATGRSRGSGSAGSGSCSRPSRPKNCGSRAGRGTGASSRSDRRSRRCCGRRPGCRGCRHGSPAPRRRRAAPRRSGSGNGTARSGPSPLRPFPRSVLRAWPPPPSPAGTAASIAASGGARVAGPGSRVANQCPRPQVVIGLAARDRYQDSGLMTQDSRLELGTRVPVPASLTRNAF